MPRKAMRKQFGGELDYVMSIGKDLAEHTDEWIAVVDSKMVANGHDASEVYRKAKEAYPDKTPFIMKVPTPKVMVL